MTKSTFDLTNVRATYHAAAALAANDDGAAERLADMAVANAGDRRAGIRLLTAVVRDMSAQLHGALKAVDAISRLPE